MVKTYLLENYVKIINFDILSNPGEFELILLPTSIYQKKNGTVAVMKGGLLEQIVARCPSLPAQMGKGVETYGNCPAILSHIPNTKHPTKFMTFPVSPSTLRAKEPDHHVFHRLKGRFKKYALLPGWCLLPRSDMVEFSSIKLKEIIRYYKLSKVALPFDLFTLGKEEVEKEQDRIMGIISRIVPEGLSLIHHPKENPTGTFRTSVATSEVYFEEGETNA